MLGSREPQRGPGGLSKLPRVQYTPPPPPAAAAAATEPTLQAGLGREGGQGEGEGGHLTFSS